MIVSKSQSRFPYVRAKTIVLLIFMGERRLNE